MNTTPPRTPSRNSRNNRRRPLTPHTPSRNSRNNRRRPQRNTPSPPRFNPISPPRTPPPIEQYNLGYGNPFTFSPGNTPPRYTPSPPRFNPISPPRTPIPIERYNLGYGNPFTFAPGNTPSPNISPHVNLFQNADNNDFQMPGIAFEVHNKFNKHFEKNKKKYFEIISPFTKEDNNYLIHPNIIDHVKYKLEVYIYEHYVEQEKQPLIEKLNAIFDRVKNTEYITEPKYKLLIGKTIDFVLQQEEDFVKFYLSSFSHDCYYAYTGPNGMSCAKGILERFYLLIGDTAFALCPETCENETYENLKKLFNKKIDKNELTQEWANTYLESDEIRDLSVENRKKHYINFMIEKYKEADLYDDTIKEEIQKEADTFGYAFESLAFGGRKKKRRTIKKNKNKKTKKSKRRNK